MNTGKNLKGPQGHEIDFKSQSQKVLKYRIASIKFLKLRDCRDGEHMVVGGD